MRLNFPKRFHNVFIPYVHGKDDLLKFTLSKNLAKIYSRYRSGNNFACIIKIIIRTLKHDESKMLLEYNDTKSFDTLATSLSYIIILMTQQNYLQICI